jgi:LytS/YehU family sensor histidine kinase
MIPANSAIDHKYILAISLTGGLLLSLVPILFALDEFRFPGFYLRLLDVALLYTLVAGMFYAGIWLNLKWQKLPGLKKWLMNGLFLIIYTSVSIAIHVPIWKATAHVPIHFYFKDEIVRNLIIVLVSFFAVRFFVKISEIQILKRANVDLQNEHLNNQLTVLMNQINPHFFFNTLNTLSGLIQENPGKSEIFIDKLSHVFRYILNMQETSKVSLKEELKFARDYAFLLQVRFEEKLKINILVNNSSSEMVPSLCTQLLIENVIKHNRMNHQFPVTVDITTEDGYLKISNNHQPQKSESSTGLGLKNLNRRSEILSGKPILIVQTADAFCVSVPLIHS